MTYNFKRLKVKSLPGIAQRIGDCPRGYNNECGMCKHFRALPSNDSTTFDCFDMSIDKVYVRTYLAAYPDSRNAWMHFEPHLLITYNEAVIIDEKMISHVPSFTKTLEESSQNYPELTSIFTQRIADLITKGQIMLEN